MSRTLGYLGTSTIHQDGVKTEATAARYFEGGAFNGRYWSPNPQVPLREGEATIRFHDSIEAIAVLTRVGPDSGRFVSHFANPY